MKIKKEPKEPQRPERGRRFEHLPVDDGETTLRSLLDRADEAGVKPEDAVVSIDRGCDYSSIDFGYWRDETDEEMAPKIKYWEKHHQEWVKKHAAWKQWYEENKGDVQKYLVEREAKLAEKAEKQRLAELKKLEQTMAVLEKRKAALLK